MGTLTRSDAKAKAVAEVRDAMRVVTSKMAATTAAVVGIFFLFEYDWGLGFE